MTSHIVKNFSTIRRTTICATLDVRYQRRGNFGHRSAARKRARWRISFGNEAVDGMKIKLDEKVSSNNADQPPGADVDIKP